jgi:RHS repeat-associated protein
MSRTAKRRMICAVPALGAFVACAAVLVGSMTLLAAPPQPLRGDLNLDGVVDTGDVGPFVLAVQDPAAWEKTYAAGEQTLVSVGDFDGDGAVSTADIHGFVAVVLASLPRGSDTGQGSALRATGTRLDRTTPVVDLDIDSSNNKGLQPPARSSDEDVVEDEPYASGKQILIGSANRVPAILDAEYPSQGSTDNFQYRLTFPAEVSIAIPAYFKGEEMQDERVVTSAADNDFAYLDSSGVPWIRGDANCDGSVNGYDLDAFLLAMTNPTQYRATYNRDVVLMADFNDDWAVNGYDIDPFVAIMTSGQEQPVHVHLLVAGESASVGLGETRIVAEASTDGDQSYDPYTETDAVRVTVWDGEQMPNSGELGAAPAWGAAVAVSPFSAVNLRNGNLLTAIDLCSYEPLGPELNFTLYHNSLGSGIGTDFEIAGGWSASFGTRVVGWATEPVVTLVRSDGSSEQFTTQGGSQPYLAPPGYHEQLRYAGVWRLSDERNWTACFNYLTGRLAAVGDPVPAVEDSAGNSLVIVRDGNGRITKIRSAAETGGGALWHHLDLSYTSNRLSYIQEYFQKSTQELRDGSRKWTFEYDAHGRLWKINYPFDTLAYRVPESCVEIIYDGTSDRIEQIIARDGKSWSYAYTDGALIGVTDIDDQEEPRFSQSIACSAAPDSGTGLFETEYTDRRGKTWLYRFDALGNLRESENPLNDVTTSSYDAWHNPVQVADGLGHAWSMTYGPVGNVTSISSPLTGDDAQSWQMDWEQPGTSSNFLRLTDVTDPLARTVSYAYESALDPSLVTSVTEPAAVQGGDAAITTLDYYDGTSEQKHAKGRLSQVVDANGVYHGFYYDEYGYQTQEQDGRATPGRTFPAPMTNPASPGTFGHNGAGWTTSSGVGVAGGTIGGESTPDANGNPVVCYIMMPIDTIYPFRRLADDAALPAANNVQPMASCARAVGSDPIWDVVGRLEKVETCSGPARVIDPEYDELGRLASETVTTGGSLVEDLQITEYDENGNVLEASISVGGVAQSVSFTYDDAGRLETVTRAGLGVEYYYDAAGRRYLTENKSGETIVSREQRGFDDADRVLWIEHQQSDATPRLRVEYAWNADNTVANRTDRDYDDDGFETGALTVVYQYDNRQRLLRETASDSAEQVVYDLEYKYDQLGNRLWKKDHVGGGETVYLYDINLPGDTYPPSWAGYYTEVADPYLPPVPAEEFWTRNNRLLHYMEYDANGALLRTVSYTYFQMGHVSNITIRDGDPREAGSEDTWECHDLGLFYTTDGKLWRARWSHWDENSEGPVGSVTYTAARKFYYDGPRQRYLTQEVDPTTWQVLPEGEEPTQAFTTYLGDMPWADFTVDEDWAASKVRDYLTGDGLHAQKDTADPPNVEFLHGDLIGSTMLTTGDSGAPVQGITYTAFGEPVFNDGSGWQVSGALPEGYPRYAYAGQFGYESDLLTVQGTNETLAPVTLAHVGWRWYQPGIGRFVQRDPIGLRGGLNAYVYCEDGPSNVADPTGLATVDPGGFGGSKGGLPLDGNGWIRMPPGTRPVLGPDGRTWMPGEGFAPGAGPGLLGSPGAQNAVCVAWAIGSTAGAALDYYHPGTSAPYHDYIGGAIYRLWTWVTSWF